MVDDERDTNDILASLVRPRGFEAIQVFSGAQALAAVSQGHPDLILLDLGLPSINGIETARRLRRLLPQSKILFVSQESSPDVVREALNTGARGYVIKQRANDLLRAVTAALI